MGNVAAPEALPCPRPHLGRLEADLILLGITFLWGSTFVIVKNAISAYPVFAFLAIRFGLALVVLLPILVHLLMKGKLHLSWRQLGYGLLTGGLLFAGYALQTLGLQSATAGRAGFFTGMSVIIVPFIAAVVYRRLPGWPPLVGAGFAAAGLYSMFLPAARIHGSLWPMDPGDLLLLGCAFAFAGHVVAISRFGAEMHEAVLSVLQIGVVFVASLLVSIYWEVVDWPAPGPVWATAAFTGIVVTAGVLLVQTRAQRYTTPAHAAIIFSLEPVFAMLTGYLLAGEQVGREEAVGSALILLGMLVAEAGAARGDGASWFSQSRRGCCAESAPAPHGRWRVVPGGADDLPLVSQPTGSEESGRPPAEHGPPGKGDRSRPR
ncbi:MAG: DMT family transporter [Limnochordales bacterium]|nr:DMT family transporter [Limnochordales bacterium]